MPEVFKKTLDTPVFKGELEVNTGLFINGQWVDGSEQSYIDVINPTTGTLLTRVSQGTPADVDLAVSAAHTAFTSTWGHNTPGASRGVLLNKLANLMDEHRGQLSALEALDNGKTFSWARNADLELAIGAVRYYAGWADKIQGRTIETTKDKLAYTVHEPIGVVALIIPWNFPILIGAWKLAPALAAGNTVIIKPSEFTPLTMLYLAHLAHLAGFPPGVINVVNGTGPIVGNALTHHAGVDKVGFTGSTPVGRQVLEASARTNLKDVTLELGGKSPNIIFEDADLEQAVRWAVMGIFWNDGQTCSAGSRVFVHAKIYDAFLEQFTAAAKALKTGDPFDPANWNGPLVSQQHFDRVLGYIASGKEEGATVHLGGSRQGTAGYFVEPTIFTNVTPTMRIVREEIFGPVAVVIKFSDDADVVRQANDTVYGLAAAVFTKNVDRALVTARELKAGTVWVNCVNSIEPAVPFGGYKQSGMGRDLGEYALHHYTSVKAVHINLGK
ncbi:aldehyde dehydrogenase [Trametopsis cervina]|nr:aldehyde dehydrogenase [Trametopsis cervina]